MAINTTTLSGNVGQDPEIRYLPSGKVVAQFSLAVRTGKDTTLWMPCKAWEKTAELVGEYFRKGSPVTVSGQLTSEEWKTPEGEKRSRLALNIRDVQLPPKGLASGSQSYQGMTEDDIPF